tara:strand:+ start:5 stop:2080 length:2076 start_codon:yes stop_codon:yes gene_type:complete
MSKESNSSNSITKWNINKKAFIGELYDLTASSTMGLRGFETGKIKNTEALTHGITETLNKYYEELTIILKDSEDDKHDKRKEIYELLDYCISIDKEINKLSNLETQDIEIISIKNASFNKLFNFTTNYLNGSDGSSQFNNQPLIVTIAGGNPLKIFFAILTLLHNSNKDINYDEFIEKYYSKIEANEQKLLLKTILENLKSLLKCQLPINLLSADSNNLLSVNMFNLIFDLNKNSSLKLQFSDMDFAIVPNKNEILDTYINKSKTGGTSTTSTSTMGTSITSRPTTGRVTRSHTASQRDGPSRKEQLFQTLQENEAKKKIRETRKRKKQKSTEPSPAKTRRKPSKIYSPRRKSSKDNQNHGLKSSKDNQNHGFLLVRLKTSNQYVAPYIGVPENLMPLLKNINIYATQNVEACNNENDLNILGKSLKFLAQPQLFRQAYFSKSGITSKCKIFLKYLQATKNLIKELTSMNINIFIDYLTKDNQDDTFKLSKFMNFLNENSYKQNKTIEELFKTNDFAKKYISKDDIILNFNSIESICDPNKPLVEVMNRLVVEFSKRKEVTDVIKNISGKFAGKNFKSSLGGYNNIFFTPKLASILDLSNDYLLHAKQNKLIPDNSKITTNATFKPINLESSKKTTDIEIQNNEKLLRDLNNFLLEEDIEDIMIPEFEKLNLGKGVTPIIKYKKKRTQKTK